ncbi:YlqD family protein [Anoxybacteroides tepidamans]|uniref:YlqD family protein n=1 Tax=Anoxybacteroides tepidamans TaxID=265948 RepID=UPI00048963E1|nr:YlqD family protein [Anoxybacillus tepidamans]
MKIIQTVEVKQILTEKSRAELREKFAARKRQLQQECDQLRFEQKKLEKSAKYSPTVLKQYFTKEIDDRVEKIKLLDFQMEQLHILPLGSELKEREVQALVEVKVGDRWEDIMAKRAIIVKNGIVEEIR